MENVKGSCLCGAVKFTVAKTDGKFHACHCNMCRKWGGAPALSINCGKDVEFAGEENISIYESSDWAQRGFCKKCGSNVFYQLKGSGDYFMQVGSFDTGEFEFVKQVFIDKKPHYYEFANKTENLTEKQIFEMYGG